MNTKQFLPAVLAIFLMGSSPSWAQSTVTLDFDFLSGVYSSVAPGGTNVYEENGFIFTTPVALNNHFDSAQNGP